MPAQLSTTASPSTGLASLDAAMERITRTVRQDRAKRTKQTARKILRGLSGHREGPFVLPLTAARASQPDPAGGVKSLVSRREALMRHAPASEVSQFRAALLCLRWRRRFERVPLRLVVDNTMVTRLVAA